MYKFIISRTFEALIVLMIVSIFMFGFVRLLPGSPAKAIYGEQFQKMTKTEQYQIEENLGLHQPLPVQYVKWVNGVLHGEWGNSYRTGQNVSEMIRNAIGPTLSLTVAATLITLIFSIIIGIYTGLNRYGFTDYITTIISFLFMSLPSFWLALMLLLLFSIQFQVFPTAGMGSRDVHSFLMHITLPALVLALSHIGYWIRLLRNHVAITKDKPFIQALIARGISKRKIIFKHIVRNAALPFLSYIGVALSLMLAGSAVVETIFSWPGLGMLSIQAAMARDYPIIITTTLLSTLIIVGANMLSDIAAAWIDPRLRHEMFGKKGV